VIVKPYALIEDQVAIGPGSVIGPHAVIHAYTRMGERNEVHAHAVLGDIPQHTAYDGSETWLEIGHGNVIREGVTLHRSITPDQPTRIGSDCYLMAYAHVAHDCRVGDGVIITNNVCLGGHVEVGDKALLGGGALIHQFVRIGAYAMVAAFVVARKDVLPYCMAAGNPLRHYRLNTLGLRRAGIQGQAYGALEAAFRTLRSGQALEGVADTPEVALLRAWLGHSKRGLSAFVRRS
jgi:UDP-N-acetylglucosamine acyltransferase